MVEVDSFLAAGDGPSLVGLLVAVDSEGLAAPGFHMVVVVIAKKSMVVRRAGREKPFFCGLAVRDSDML